MLRAVLDTDVFVSAVIRPAGTPGRVLARLLDGVFELVLSPALVAELRVTLGQPRLRKYLGLDAAELDRRVTEIETIADPVSGTLTIQAPLRDPDDLIVLAAAVEGRADYVVTGDDDLLALREYEGVGIVTPRDFLVLLGP